MVRTSFLNGPAPGSGLGYVGEARVMPDLSTKRTIPWYTISSNNFTFVFLLF